MVWPEDVPRRARPGRKRPNSNESRPEPPAPENPPQAKLQLEPTLYISGVEATTLSRESDSACFKRSLSYSMPYKLSPKDRPLMVTIHPLLL